MQSGSEVLIHNLSPLTAELRSRFSLAPLDVLKIYRAILQFSQQEMERINNEAKEKWGKEATQPLPRPLKYIQSEWAIYHKIYCAMGILGGISAEKFGKKTQQEYFYAALYLVLSGEYSDVLGRINPEEAQYLFGLGSKPLRLHTFKLLEHLFELPKHNCETLAYLVPGGDSKEMDEVLAPYETYKKAKSAHIQNITDLLPTDLENLSNHLNEQLQIEIKTLETLSFRNTLLPLKQLPSIQLKNTNEAIAALNHTIKRLAKQPFKKFDKMKRLSFIQEWLTKEKDGLSLEDSKTCEEPIKKDLIKLLASLQKNLDAIIVTPSHESAIFFTTLLDKYLELKASSDDETVLNRKHLHANLHLIRRYKEEAAELARDCQTIKDEAIGNENDLGEIPMLKNAIELQLGNLPENSSDPVISRLSAFKNFALQELQRVQEQIKHLNPIIILELLEKERHKIYKLRLQAEQKSLDILKKFTLAKLKIFSTYIQLACKEIEDETDSYLNKLADEIITSLKKNDESKTDLISSQDAINQFWLNNNTEIADDLKPLFSKFNSAYLARTHIKKNNLIDAKLCIEGHLSEFKAHRGNIGFVTHYLGLDERFNAFKPRGRVWAEFFCEKEKQVQEFLSASTAGDIDIFEIDNGYAAAKQEKDQAKAKAISGQSRSRYRAVM